MGADSCTAAFVDCIPQSSPVLLLLLLLLLLPQGHCLTTLMHVYESRGNVDVVVGSSGGGGNVSLKAPPPGHRRAQGAKPGDTVFNTGSR
jgi:hypothetical protein